ncbi:MAG: pantetheine-phosphate adenylyltransferase [Clostridiales bacterium]|nr:pantetheine-phosphate adenylyltransferase [Clostridiales bacterium]
MSKAIYPGSFDPVTVGHLHIAERACRLFDQVIIAVADQNYKNSLFDLEERKAFIADAVAHLPNCSIDVYSALTVDFAKKHGANAIIRGLRAISDYEYEMQIATINKYLDDSIETVFLLSGPEYSFISSSMIKQVGRTGAKITGLVTPMVEEAIKNRLFGTSESSF